MNDRRPGLEDRPLLAWPAAAAARLRTGLVDDWRMSPLYRLSLRGPEPVGVAVRPRDYRPIDPDRGRAILAGRLTLAGETMEIGPGGDPWDTASPSRRFAVELHRFAWLPDLLGLPDSTLAPQAREEALRLVLDWRSLFDRISPFAWGAETLERRVYNLACAAPALVSIASEVEQSRLLVSLAEQARHLLRLRPDVIRRAERTCAAAVAGAVMDGRAGDRILNAALPALVRALRLEVLPDGGSRSRNPEQGMELLLDLLTLDDALHQQGLPSPADLGRAIDRLTGSARFFTLGDGRLSAFHGGEASTAARVAAAVAHEDPSARLHGYAPQSGYHRLSARAIRLMVDAAAPPVGPWSVAACAQPAAFELSCGADRLIVNSGWSVDADASDAFRLADAATTASIGDTPPGAPLTGLLAQGLGRRLAGGARRVEVRRNENETGVWLELVHDGWADTLGLLHERRFFLDLRADELRGEDRFRPRSDADAGRRRLLPYALRFHLAPGVQVSLARDGRSALLRGPSNRGWWLRNDAPDVALEPSVHFEDRQSRRTVQLVLRGQIGLDGAARVRWKLTPVEIDATPPGGAST